MWCELILRRNKVKGEITEHLILNHLPFYIWDLSWDLGTKEQNVVWTLSIINREQIFRHPWVLLITTRYIYFYTKVTNGCLILKEIDFCSHGYFDLFHVTNVVCASTFKWFTSSLFNFWYSLWFWHFSSLAAPPKTGTEQCFQIEMLSAR